MLRLDKLRPGDVILSRTRSLISAANRQAQIDAHRPQRKLFSHAALVAGQNTWWESVGYGVGFKHVRLDKIETHQSKTKSFAAECWKLHALEDGYEVGVYRHPSLASCPPEQSAVLASQIHKLGIAFLGLAYPPLASLCDASSLLKSSPSLKRHVVACVTTICSILQEEIVNPGPFCSELVCTILGDVTDPNGDTIHILKANRKPFEVSPSDLADDVVSNLEEVPPEEFLCNEDLSIPDKCDLFAFSPYRSLPEELRKQIEEVMSDDVNRDERWTEAGPKLVADMVAANQALIRVVRANDAIVKSMQQLTQIAEAGREVRSD